VKFLTFALIVLSPPAFACPDVSGKFGAFCKETRTCVGATPTESASYYGFELKQTACTQIEAAYLFVTGSAIFRKTYDVGVDVYEPGEMGRSITTTFTYTADQLIKQEVYSPGTVVNIQKYSKRVDASGAIYLAVEAELTSSKCQTVSYCQLPMIP